MNKLSAKHFILFILGVTCISFKTYPSLFIKLGGRDTWVYTLITFFVFLAFAIYLIYVMSSRKTYDINEIFTSGLSKYIGNLFLFLFALGLFLASIEATTVEANVVKTCFFLKTPAWYIIIFFLIPSVILLGKNFKTLLIFIIISVFSLLANTVLLDIIVETYKDVKYVLPVFSGNVASELLNTGLLILGSLSAFVIALPYLKYLTKDDKIKKHSLIALLIIGFVCTYVILGIISTFGPLRAANIFYPEFPQSQRVQIAGFLEFGELFFLYQTVVGFFVKYILCAYGVYLIFEKFIKNRKYFIAIYTILVFIISTLLAGNNYVLFNILKYYQYVNLVLFILIPLIAFIAFNFKFKKK
ncbi:endospore germination permease [Clostridium celatum]|uniref:Spore germination protein n=1 Tax=Clostridium celatum DSM 1785 TaxID=545697 RepID=L1Q9N0_9CLOT|nr:endospore germination permease [Clostridium celatum]EKY24425.1 spore germination protein [Clostridium celatum DSM 1785]MCE9655024.1 endospore germination permease [Clostridium celatum]MDY3362019.1 endospore germination permease [Clostridium celatum]